MDAIDVGVDSRKHHPYLYHFRDVDWAIFGSVTWSRPARRCPYSARAGQCRRKDIEGVLYRTCVDLDLRKEHLAYYWATEFGAAGECHMHFLVASDGLGDVAPAEFARVFTEMWTRDFRSLGCQKPGVGTAVVKPYDQAYEDRGAAYCLKREYDDSGRERERFDFLSPRLFNLIQKYQRVNVEMLNGL